MRDPGIGHPSCCCCSAPRLLLPGLGGERRELFTSKGQHLGKLQAWGTSSLVLSSSVHVNTACGCDHGMVGAVLAGKAGEQL